MTDPLPLATADIIAAELVRMLEPVCERIAIAGSVRRRKALVKDIEIVCIPKIERAPSDPTQPTLFDAPVEVDVDLVSEAVAGWMDMGFARPRLDKNGARAVGPSYKRLLVNVSGPDALPVGLDLFSVTPPAQWGLIYLIRTGAGVGPGGSPRMGFGPAVLARWKQVSGGGRSEAGCLRWPNGEQRETPEEEDVFEACRMRFVPPEERTDATVVGRYLLP